MNEEALIDGLDLLEARLGGAGAMLGAFNGELERLRSSALFTGREMTVLSAGLSGGLRRAFDGLVFDGTKLSDALDGLARSIVNTVYSIAMRPIQNAAGGALAEGLSGLMGSLLPFAKGAAFSQGQVMPFAKGGIVSTATSFPMRGGRGLMGEAGPEAILPLRRGIDGRLGVATQGGGRQISVVMNISTPDVQGFRRSESQIAAEVTRALSRGQRNR